MNNIYKKQVGLLIKIIPQLYLIKEFAIHGGTIINLFIRDMPRYSFISLPQNIPKVDLFFFPETNHRGGAYRRKNIDLFATFATFATCV